MSKLNKPTNISLIFKKDMGNTDILPNFIPLNDMGEENINEILPQELQRDITDLPNLAESAIIRHYVNLSEKNYGLDNGFYPLGSCTMKYNPKINEYVATLPQFTMIHPLQEECQGTLEMMYKLSNSLSEITGMDAFTLDPAAGAHGELVGLFIIKKYFEDQKIEGKNKIIVPDSAHGTNPASAAMSGFSMIEIASDENGELPLDKLEFAMKGGDVAGLMLTNPNTLGLFDRKITQITEIVHKYSGLCYYDGANMNPLLGTARPGDMGFDIIHLNLHKTFSTPHGGGGPGAGPVGVKSHLSKYLPQTIKKTSDGEYVESQNADESIGKIHSFYGNTSVLLKAYTYILGLGADGLRNAGQIAVLNANYLRSKLKSSYNLAYDRVCMHEFVLSDKNIPNDITTDDISKRLLDYGIHSPTVYFPLIVHGAIMVEPTETESLDTLDDFIQIMEKVRNETENNPELVKNAPSNTSVGRLDATLAARKPCLRD